MKSTRKWLLFTEITMTIFMLLVILLTILVCRYVDTISITGKIILAICSGVSVICGALYLSWLQSLYGFYQCSKCGWVLN